MGITRSKHTEMDSERSPVNILGLNQIPPSCKYVPGRGCNVFKIDNDSRNVKFFTTKLRDFTCYGGGSGDKELDD